MDNERLKFCINTLRIFIRGGERGNYLTLHADEIENSLCRSMCKRSANDRRNIHDQLLAILNALKDKGVFFLGQDDWSDDKLPRSKKKDKKKIYGLTDRAIKFLDLQKAAGNSGESNDTIKRLLQHFDILPRPDQEQTLIPEVARAAVENNQKPTGDDMRIINVKPQPVEINVQTLITAVRNKSASWTTKSTPADLLGGMLELWASTPATAVENVVGSMAKLGWPRSRHENYAKVCKFLVELGLAELDRVHHRTVNNQTITCGNGVRLTPLGAEVAVEGGFVDGRPENERETNHAKQETEKKPAEKSGAMLKGQKTEKKPSKIRCQVDPKSGELFWEFPTVAEALAFRKGFESGAVGETQVAPLPKALGMYETIAGFVGDVSRAIFNSLLRLRSAELPDGTAAETIDPVYMLYATTQMAYVLNDLKYELSEVIYAAENGGPGGEIDMERLRAYFEGVESSLENILHGGKRVIPSLRPALDTRMAVCKKIATGKGIAQEYIGPHENRLRQNSENLAAVEDDDE